MNPFERFSKITKDVFLFIKENPGTSRVEIAKRLNLSEATISRHVKTLIDANLILESGTGDSRIGRKPVNLVVNPSAFQILGIHVAYEKIKFDAFNLSGERTFTCRIQISQNIAFDEMFELILKTIKRKKLRRILGIGFAIPAPLDYSEKRLIYSRFYGWRNILLPSFVMIDSGKVPIFWENDANLSAIGFHRKTNCNNIVSVYLDKGVGVGILKDGKIHRGSNGQAGEIGQVLVRKKPKDNFEELEKLIIEESHRDFLSKHTRETLGFTLAIVLRIIDPDILAFNGEIPRVNKKMMRLILKEIKMRLKDKEYPVVIYNGKGIDPIFLGIQQMVFMNMLEAC